MSAYRHPSLRDRSLRNVTMRRQRRSRKARPPRASAGGEGRKRAARRSPGLGGQLAGIALFVLATLVVALLTVGLFEADFVVGLVFGFCLLLSVLGTPKAFGLWRGTVSHETINETTSRVPMSRDGKRAAAPCGIISFDGITLVFAAAVVPTSDLDAGLLLLLGVTMFIVFFLLSLCVGWFRRPRFLLPKSMRPG